MGVSWPIVFPLKAGAGDPRRDAQRLHNQERLLTREELDQLNDNTYT